MIHRVVKFGEPVLSKKAELISDFNAELRQLADDMLETMNDANGLGLAGPQIGVSKRIFVIDMCKRTDQTEECKFTLDGKTLPLELAMPLIAINPKLTNAGEFIETADEGCLSLPSIWGEVDRFLKVKLNYQDLSGAPHEIICEGLFARCIQHESDHLEGLTFTDRMLSKNITKILPKLKKLKRQSRDFIKEQKNS